MIIEELFKIIKDRKKRLPEGSYTASLFRKSEDEIIQKVGEEAIEVIVAAKGKDRQRIIEEVADLWFHTFILLASLEISPEEIYIEFKKRLNRRKQM